MHELSLSGAIVNTVDKHAGGRPGERREHADRARCARWCRTRSSSTSSSWRGDGLRGRAAGAGADPGAAALRRVRARVGDRAAGVPVPGMRRRGRRGRRRRRVRGGVDRGRGGRMHRTKVRIVEEALDANNTIAQANRADFDRAGVTRRELHERAGRRQDDAARAGRWPTCDGVRVGRAGGRRAGHRWTPTGWPALHVPVTQLNTDPASAASATSTRTWCARRSARCRSTRSTCW